MMDSRGSIWKKWDLHVHTPESLIHQYPGNSSEVWERYLNDLESLPPEYKVLGINDYIFLDGYKRIKEERNAGRLKNIESVFPVVELRLKSFGGTRSNLSRVNYHIIFSNELDASTIEEQFLYSLRSRYELSPEYAHLKWDAVPTRNSIKDLGQLIIDSVPEEQRANFQSPLLEGFNNLNFSLEQINEALNSHYFRNKHITAVGKTEWWDIKWNDQSIAEKKNIINSSDLVFISSETPENYNKAKNSLHEHNVNDKLLDCSDAHYLSNSAQKDRIGNCFTWIKGDTTFQGLLHALKEFSDRVYIGTEPEVCKRLRTSGSQFFTSLKIKKKFNSSLDEVWFDNTEIEFNPGLIGIIGNKGSGKSALAETLALLGNSEQEEYFSFLNDQKFRKRKDNKSQHFWGSLKWGNGDFSEQLLNKSKDTGTPENIKFIPQNFLETICNEIPSGEETKFDKELKRVIYSHVEPMDRHETNSLDELISYKTQAIEESIFQLRNELTKINHRIVDLEEKSRADHYQALKNSLNLIKEKLRDLRNASPLEVNPPEMTNTQEISDELEEKKIERERIISEIEQSKKQLGEANNDIINLNNLYKRVQEIQRQYDDFLELNNEQAQKIGLNLNLVVNLNVDWATIDGIYQHIYKEKERIEALLDEGNYDGLYNKQKAIDERILELQSKLDEPNKKYQEYLSAMEEWRNKRKDLIGSKDEPETALYYRAKLHQLKFIPEKLESEQQKRNVQCKLIHQKILELNDEYRELYKPIQKFIGEHPVNQEIQLTFDVAIVNMGFKEKFFEYIVRNVSGTFCGMSVDSEEIEDLMPDDMDDTDSVISFVNEITQRLHYDFRDQQMNPVDIKTQLKKGKNVAELYDFIYGLSYLTPRYAIKFGGKNLHELSPGEKGTLLLIFYLLVDKGGNPLIIDQPEDNLDNQTVYKVLVRCIKEARTKRQIVLVTHNPNLAVVCDADQIIVVSIDKENKNRVQYDLGAIENPEINKHIVNILEGTKPAFENRNNKYLFSGINQ